MANVIDAILNPRTVAVIGASKDPAKRGYRAIETLLADHYSGEIIPINLREKEILGLPCYARISDVPREIDTALVCTPARLVPEIIEECGRKGVKGAVIFAGGFSEAGEEGRLLEERAVEIARRHGLRIVGPNMNGIFSARYNYNAIAWFNLPRGNLALIANSANIALSIVTQAQVHKYAGFSTILSVGNQADLEFHEYLGSLAEDAGTQAVISYVEGFKHGRAYYDVARATTPKKPIVIYKAGRNADGVRMAKSHSGSLAGDFAVSSGVLKQAGITLVSRSDMLYPVAEALTLLPPMRGRNVAVISEGGGPITIAAEALVDGGMVLAPLSAATMEKLHAIVPNSSAISNPVDIGSATDPVARNYGLAARAILEDPDIDALLLVGYFGGYVTRYGESVAAEETAVAEDLARMMRELGKPIVVQTHYAEFATQTLDLLRKAGVPFQRTIETAVECICAAANYSAAKRRLAADAARSPISRNAAADEIIRVSRQHKRDALLETEARALLAACGVPLAQHVLVRSADEMDAIAPNFKDAPVAMKIVSRHILHKSDAGGVKLDVRGLAHMRAAFGEIVANALAHKADAEISGVLIAPMARKGVEMIVGVVRDPQFGPVIMLGLGGVFVEVMRDVVFRTLPLTRGDAVEMIGEIRNDRIFAGVRGLPPADKDALAELLLSISAVCHAYPEIAELDLNPVIVHGKGYTIADARVILES